MLQYAKELQMEFTEVHNSETLVAVLQEEDRGTLCIGDDDDRIKMVSDLVFNTEKRLQFFKTILQKYMTSYSLPNPEDVCDISI